MEETLFQKLQRVRPSDIGHIFLFLLAVIPSLFYRLSHRDLWLICDNKNEARDNGYHLYKYICENHPEQDCVYAISRRSRDYDRVRGLGKTVNYGSLLHWIMYLSASINISSQKGGKPNAAVCYFLEVNGILKNTRVFLQHGIIKDDMPFLHYKNTMMSMFVCSTKRETDFVAKNYGYPEGSVKELGLCRFDRLHDFKVIKNQVLLMPTWRSWIATPTSASDAIEDVSDFRNTAYFRAWSAFLSDSRLHTLLEKYRLHLVFYPHRDMQQYLKYFDINDSLITVASFPEYDVQTLLKESAYLITDFSSIAMDFAYMNKRLMYYQFDYEDFRLGQYPEGYFSYEHDGFGRVCYDIDSAFEEIELACKQGFENPGEYKKRHDEFFDLYDTDNCKRNYEAIRELRSKNGK